MAIYLLSKKNIFKNESLDPLTGIPIHGIPRPWIGYQSLGAAWIPSGLLCDCAMTASMTSCLSKKRDNGRSYPITLMLMAVIGSRVVSQNAAYGISECYRPMVSAEFDQWLYQHHTHLRDYQAWEVARLALACGFEMRDIAPDISVWVTVSRRKLQLWSNPLMLQWAELWGYERGHDWEK